MPFAKVAKKMGIGIDVVKKRYKKLQEDGVILNSTIVLDFRTCGFEGLCGLLITVNPELNNTQILEALKNAPNAFLLGEMWGDYEFYLESYYRKFDEILKLVNYIQKIDGVLNVDLLLFTGKNWSIPSEFNFEASYPVFPDA